MVREAHQGRRTIYGALLILALVGSALFIFFLDDIIGAFRDKYTLVALVADAPGVAPRTPVWVGGREVGMVERVAILPTSIDTLGRVAVTVQLPVRVQQQVRVDSRVRVTSMNLMSEAVIDILPGSPAAAMAQEGDTLRMDIRLTPGQVTARAAALQDEFDTIMIALRSLAPTAEARMEETRLALAGLDAALLEAQRLRADLGRNQGVAALRDPAFRASLERARSHAAELPAMMEQLRGRAAAAGDVQAAFARLQTRADSLSAQLDDAAALLDSPLGFTGRLQQDSALIRAVNAARASLDSLIAEVRGNPLRFVF
ncbi:hypothetical protein BH23GEM9_BH23GEM9_01970 [soil metagenome]